MKVVKIIADVLSSALRYGVQERERILYLLPLLLLLGVLFGRRAPDTAQEALLRYTDRVVDSISQQRTSSTGRYRTPVTWQGATHIGDGVGRADGSDRSEGWSGSDRTDLTARSVHSVRSQAQLQDRQQSYPHELFAFDPNSVTLDELVRLGFSPKQAQVIVNYRTAGARFRRPSDFARCYTVSEQKYNELLPYIRISSENSEAVADKSTGAPAGTGSLASTVSVEDSTPTSTSTPAIISTPTSTPTPISSVSVTPPTPATATPAPRTAWRSAHERERTHELVEINTADSATLDGIYGVGALTAQRIIAYRRALGGFAHKEQLAELRGMTDQNYQRILTQIFVNSSLIQKIDVNFATPSELNAHPYVDERTTDRILKQRQLKGGWRTIQELKEQHIITQEQVVHLAPYFSFGEL